MAGPLSNWLIATSGWAPFASRPSWRCTFGDWFPHIWNYAAAAYHRPSRILRASAGLRAAQSEELAALRGQGLLAGRCAVLFRQPVDDSFQIRVAGAKSSREPVASALGDSFSVCKHVKLAGLARPANRLRV